MDTLLTIGLVGLLAAVVVAFHLSMTSRSPQADLAPAMDDVDAEFFRIIDREPLRDLWTTPPNRKG